MAILSDDQLRQIQEIIKRHHQAFVVNTIGPHALPPEVVEELRDAGLLTDELSTIEDAYQYGQVMASGENPKVASMSLDEFRGWLRSNPIPLTTQERNAVRIAEQRAAQYAVGLGNRVQTTIVNGTIVERIREAETEVAEQIRAGVRETIAEGIAQRKAVKAIVSDLQWKTKDFTRDWDRIAITEKHQAMQEGMADNYAKRYGSDALVAKVPQPDACVHCIRLHLGADGAPIIFPLSVLQANGTNVGRKVADWKAVVGTVHPHCLCTLVHIPAGWGFDEFGSLVPGGDLGKRYDTQEEIELALQQRDDLRKAVLQGHVSFQGIPIAIETKKGQIRKWTDADGNTGQTHMVYDYGYVKRTNGADEDEVDVYLGPDPAAEQVFVVDQLDPATGIYDEAKCFLGFPNKAAAQVAYHAHMTRPEAFGGITAMSVDHFKRWIAGTAARPGEYLAKGTCFTIPLKKAVTDPRLVRVVERPQMLLKAKRSGGPFIGPRGGMWADPEHKIPWKEKTGPQMGLPIGPRKEGEKVAVKQQAPVHVPTAGYQYGMNFRPPGMGAIPKGEFTHEKHADFRHGVITFQRELTPEEIKSYELTPLLSGEDIAARVDAAVKEVLADYPEEQRELAEEDPRNFALMARHALVNQGPGHLPDIDGLAETIRQKVLASGGKKDNVAVGNEIKVKLNGNLYSQGLPDETHVYHIAAVKDDQVQLSRHGPDSTFGPWMPKASVKHFINDLAGRVDVPANSGNAYIDAVSSGKAKFLGKGDDGLAFKVDDKVVKVSTTVPYNADNPGHRSPEAAVKMLGDQAALGNKLADQGIKGIQRSEYVTHGDKGFQIKPWVEIPKKFSRKQLEAIQDIVIEVHKAGYAINNSIQAGLDAEGKPVLFDVGKAAKITQAEGVYGDVTGDMGNMRMLYEEHGEPFVRRDVDEAEQLWQRVTADIIPRMLKDGKFGNAEKWLARAAKKKREQLEATLSGDELKEELEIFEDFTVSDVQFDIDRARKKAGEAEAKKSGFYIVDPLLKAGPFIGPKGGKWADAAHTIPWKPEQRSLSKVEPDDEYDPERIEPVNTVRKPEMLKRLVSDMEEHGWKGPPIVVVDEEGELPRALNGSHRILAAREANIDVPVVVIEYEDDGSDRQDALDYALNADDYEKLNVLKKLGETKAVEVFRQESSIKALHKSVTRRTQGDLETTGTIATELGAANSPAGARNPSPGTSVNYMAGSVGHYPPEIHSAVLHWDPNETTSKDIENRRLRANPDDYTLTLEEARQARQEARPVDVESELYVRGEGVDEHIEALRRFYEKYANQHQGIRNPVHVEDEVS